MRTSWSTPNYYLSNELKAAANVVFSVYGLPPGSPEYNKRFTTFQEIYKPRYLSGSFLHAYSLPRSAGEYNRRLAGKGNDRLLRVTGFSIDIDIDGDGISDSVGVRHGRESLEYFVVSKGVERQYYPNCPFHGMIAARPKPPEGEDGLELVELGLYDLNQNKIPEIWIVEQDIGNLWAHFCVLEFRGYSGDFTRPYGSAAAIADAKAFKPLISNTAGWEVKALPDRSIEICGGSYCASRWSIRWNGTAFERWFGGRLDTTFTEARPAAR